MGTIKCGNCGAEVWLPEHSRLMKGITFSEDSEGDYVLHMKRDEKGRFVSNKTETNNTENKENNTMMNNNNGANNNINGGMNMNGFDMNALATMVLQMVKAEMGNNSDVTNTIDMPKAEKKVEFTKSVENGGRWAKGSKYYGKEICGYVFNPYMFPWHVVTQFRELMNRAKDDDYNIHAIIANEYPYMYSVNFTLEMIRKLAMLQKKDKLAYYEGCRLFDFESCKRIMADYVRHVIADIENEERMLARTNKIGKEVYIYHKGYGRITVGFVVEAIEDHRVVKKIARNIELESVYAELNRLLTKLTERYGIYDYKGLYEEMRDKVKIKVGAKTQKSRYFMDCFIKRGAYYTLKANIAFEGAAFRNRIGRTAMEELRCEINKPHMAGYMVYGMLKDSMGIRCHNYRY